MGTGALYEDVRYEEISLYDKRRLYMKRDGVTSTGMYALGGDEPQPEVGVSARELA